jgi:PAS domain S-box-containing protein
MNSNNETKMEMDKVEVAEMQFELEELRDIIGNSVMPVHKMNGSGIITWANQAELDLLGYEKEDYIGKHISNFHEDKDCIENMLARIINRESLVNIPARLRSRGGQVKEVLINCNVYRQEDKIVHTSCFTTDVTMLRKENARKASAIESLEGLLETMEGKMKISEQRMHKMIAEVEDYAIILLDTEGNILNWNKGAEKIKGYKEADILGQNFRIFYLPQDRQDMLPEKLIEEASLNGRALHEGLRVRADGTTFWGTIVITALHDQDNKIIGFTKVTRDLTDKPDETINRKR